MSTAIATPLTDSDCDLRRRVWAMIQTDKADERDLERQKAAASSQLDKDRVDKELRDTVAHEREMWDGLVNLQSLSNSRRT